MKNILRLTSFLFLVFASIHVNGQYAVNDYGFVANSGNWGTLTNWKQWNGASWSINPVSTPVFTDNVFILSGKICTVEASPKGCANLTVEAGATLYTLSGVNMYIDVYGNIDCNGTIGNGATFDGISFNIEGANCTVTGTGTMDAARIRKLTAFNTVTNLFVNRNINLRFTLGNNTQIYDSAGSTTFNITVAAGCSLNLTGSSPNVGSACIDGRFGSGPERGGTITVNGTMDVSGTLYLSTDNTVSPCSLVVNSGGLLRAQTVNCAASGAGKGYLVVNSGGTLEVTGVMNVGTEPFYPFSPTNNVFTFNNGSTVNYSGPGNQTVRVNSATDFGVGLLNSYYNVIFSNLGIKTTTGNMTARNDLTISGSAVLDPFAAATTISLGGTWTDYDATGYNEKNTQVTFNGNATQYVNCSGGEVFYNLRYSNIAAAPLTFNNSVDAINQVLFSNNGYIDLNANTLTIRNSSSTGITGATTRLRYIKSENVSNASKITWRIGTATGTYRFPWGVPGSPDSIPVTVVKASASDIGDMTISTYGTPNTNLPWPVTPTNVTNLNSYYGHLPDNRYFTVDRFWEIDVTNPVATDITFSYRTIELPDSDATPANMRAQYWNIPSSTWSLPQIPGPLGTTNNVKITSNTIYNTEWTLSSIISPLPIQLLTFDAKPNHKNVDLNWSTLSEINNDHFNVERSKDGEFFESIGSIAGANNSSSRIDYQFRDEHPFNGISYYRLRQTDFDGASSLSRIVPIHLSDVKNPFSLFPVPANDKLWLTCGSQNRDDYQVEIYDVQGKLVMNEKWNASESSVYTMDISRLDAGIYMVRIEGSWMNDHLRLIKE